MPRLLSLGEMLIDFVATEHGRSLEHAQHFTKAAGGAPANVAVAAARLGMSCGFMGKVGDDPFGHFLVNTLRGHGVDTSAVRYSTTARTGLAFVSLQASGERDFLFFRHPSADTLYDVDDVADDVIRAAEVLHVGSLGLAVSPMREALWHAVRVAREADVRISYDPNLRLSLWPSAEIARQEILSLWPFAEIIKVGEEELLFLDDRGTIEDVVHALWHDRLQLMAITHGAGGCTLVTPRERVHVPGFAVPVVDTTGAGDAFIAALLVGLLRQPDAWQDYDGLTRVGRYANAVGALTTTAHGAIPALPSADRVTAFLASHPLPTQAEPALSLDTNDPISFSDSRRQGGGV